MLVVVWELTGRWGWGLLPLLCWLLVLQVMDEEAAHFIANCVGDSQQWHTAARLLEDPFLQVSGAS